MNLRFTTPRLSLTKLKPSTKRESLMVIRLLGSFSIFVLATVGLSADSIDFQRDIAPIFEEHCSYCHGEDEQESGLRLDRRVSLLRGGDYGQPAVVPKRVDKSYLIDVVTHSDAG